MSVLGEPGRVEAVLGDLLELAGGGAVRQPEDVPQGVRLADLHGHVHLPARPEGGATAPEERRQELLVLAHVHGLVLDALAKGVAFDVPPSLFRQEYDSVARAMNPNAAEQEQEQDHDQDHDDNHPAADEGMDDDAKAEAESVATRRVRLGLLVTEIGRENNIEVTEEDTRRAVLEEARRYPGQEQMNLRLSL